MGRLRRAGSIRAPRDRAARGGSRRAPRFTLPVLALLVAAPLGCGDGADDRGPACVADECDAVASRDELLAALDGHGDAIAAYLRAAASERGTLTGDHASILAGVHAATGCAEQTSFVVLSNLELIPKAVLAGCADDPVTASEVLATLPALAPDGRDVDGQGVHLAAWDAAAATYRTYATRATADGEMSINVSPGFCLGCHGGPHATGFWQPLMNEMTNPWSGWNAEPGFRSQGFDELLDPRVDGPVFDRLTAEGTLAAAADLEPIVRAGIDRVVGARLLARGGAADLEDALALVRPLFCDETINFVSEIHGGGEIRASALVDRAIPALFAALGRPLDLGETLRLPPAPAPQDGITLVPIRGESTLAVELGLVARGVLDPATVLRLRAVDLTRPAMSDARCDLWRDGGDALRAGALDLSAAATVEDMLAPIVDFLVAKTPAVELDTLAEHATAILERADRVSLARQRDLRACEATRRYAVTPIYPDLACP